MHKVQVEIKGFLEYRALTQIARLQGSNISKTVPALEYTLMTFLQE